MRQEKIEMKLQRLLVATLATTIHTGAISNDALEPIIITANRTVESINETLSMVTIIERKEIEASAAQSLPELVSQSTGLDFITKGGYGQNSSLYLRGTGSGHLLLLVNGVRFHDVTSTNSAASFEHIPVELIERVEIVRGPKASLYGSDAIGGVIQVFTKPEQQSQFASISIGTENTQKISAGFANSREKFSYSLKASQLRTDGTSSKDNNLEADGYENRSISAQLDYILPTDTIIGINSHHSTGYNEYDYCGNSSNNCQSDFTQWSTDTYWKGAINSQWDSEFHLGKSSQQRQSKNDATGDYHGEVFSSSWVNHIKLSQQQRLVSGIDYSQDSTLKSYTSSPNWKRSSTALFGNLSGDLDNSNQYNVGLRIEDNQQFGSHLTGDIAYEKALDNDSTLRLSYGEAFKAPSLYQLYDSSYGDATLQPEESSTIEIHYSRELSTGTTLNAALFNTVISNMIDWHDPDPSNDWWIADASYMNINKAEIDGLELEIDTEIDFWKLHTSLALLNPMDRKESKQLLGRAKRTLKLHGTRTLGRYNLSLDWVNQGHRFSYGDSRISGYSKLDLKLGHKLNQQTKLHFKVGNLFDKQYQLEKGFTTAGRTLLLSINYRVR